MRSLNNKIISKGELISGHIRFKAGKNHFTIIGIELQRTTEGYKLQGEQLRGLYKIDLDRYIHSDKMYLDEMEENGY